MELTINMLQVFFSSSVEDFQLNDGLIKKSHELLKKWINIKGDINLTSWHTPYSSSKKKMTYSVFLL